MNDKELEKLTQKHLDERLTKEEFKRLESFLQDSSYARSKYIESARMDSALREAHYEQVTNSLIEKRSSSTIGFQILWDRLEMGGDHRICWSLFVITFYVFIEN